MMESGDDFETASDDDLIGQLNEELSQSEDPLLRASVLEPSFVPEFPETHALLSEGKCQ